MRVGVHGLEDHPMTITALDRGVPLSHGHLDTRDKILSIAIDHSELLAARWFSSVYFVRWESNQLVLAQRRWHSTCLDAT